MIFIHHGADGLRSRRHVPGSPEERSRLSALRRFLCGSPVVGTGPGMIWRNQGRIVRMDAEGASRCQHGMVPDPAQDLVGFGLVVINARPVSPAMRRKIESHDKVLFSVGSGA